MTQSSGGSAQIFAASLPESDSEHTRAHTQSAAKCEPWDVIVVGGGMGGGAAAYELARSGLRVLLLEKGNGEYPDSNPELSSEEPESVDERLAQARWPSRIRAVIDGRTSDVWPSLGCGLGGSTSLYGAALGRLEPADFHQQAIGDGVTLQWPIRYDELEPYYIAAEQIMRVCGGRDSLNRTANYELRPPPAMSDNDRFLFEAMTQSGLHPYRIHVSIDYVPGCTECGGHVCPRRCKGDARNRFIEPAVREFALEVQTQTEVHRLALESGRVTGVWVREATGSGASGGEQMLPARVVVLAAGALFTPVLLQNSTSPEFTQGVGNGADLVGRYLMFHASDFLAAYPRGRHDRSGPARTLAVRDFYEFEGQKLGEIQSTGLSAGYWAILGFLRAKLQRSLLGRIPLMRQLLRIPAWIAAKVFSDATIFASIVEDFPYFENRVIADDSAHSRMRFEYRMPDELKRRVILLRRLFRSRLKSVLVIPLNLDVELNLGHPCGTCRAGTDAATSVVDSQCRIHGVDNVYIADASIMPSSGGVNPSLTIAANALRVAECIAANLRQSELAETGARETRQGVTGGTESYREPAA